LSDRLISGNAHGREHMMLTLDFRDGTVVAKGGHGLSSRITVPVAAGPGKYAGGRGTLAVASGPKES
jgi:hypothetical protein